MLDLHPKPQTQPITPRMAFVGLEDTDAPVLPDWLKRASRLMEPGNYSGDNAATAFKKVKGNTAGGMNTKLLSWDRCACTLTKSEISTTGIIHPDKQRYLSVGEMKRIASFPDAFQFVGSRKNAVERIGNSVPPNLMQAIAENIYSTLLDPSGRKEEEHHMPLDFINKPINPDTPRLFNVISTFAGCGGSSLGYKWAGGKVLAAIEWDENAVATYRLNHQGTPVLHRDIKTVTAEELLELTGLQPGELDILDGSPPCQGFSTAGKRQIDDPRNSLFQEYVRLLRGLQPKCFVMENVSGMVKGDMKHVFAIVMRELKASGYQVKCQLMNAMYFGVPQSRERVIFIGVRDDLGIQPSHPTGQAKPVMVREAFEGVADDGTGNRVKPTTKVWQAMRSVKPGNTQPGHFSHCRLRLDKPAGTLRSNFMEHYHVWHPVEHRVLTLAECKRIGSFPDAFQLIGTPAQQWGRIGNSVPPRFMQAIAQHIYTHILSKVTPLERQEVVHA